MNQYWIPWILGMLLPLGFKFGHRLYTTNRAEISFWRALAGFVFSDYDATFRTTLNLAVEFYIGAIYIDKLPAPFMPALDMPVHWGTAFLFAFAAELIVPFAINQAVERCKRRIQKWSED